MGLFSLAAGAARRKGAVLAIGVCLAVALLLMTAGAARAISGYGSDTPAVAAQYPDSRAGHLGPKPAFSSLGQAITRTRKMLRDPQVSAQVKAADKVIARETTQAIATSAGLAPLQSSSIALLIAGVGVVALGVFLRWRRGTQI